MEHYYCANENLITNLDA